MLFYLICRLDLVIENFDGNPITSRILGQNRTEHEVTANLITARDDHLYFFYHTCLEKNPIQ